MMWEKTQKLKTFSMHLIENIKIIIIQYKYNING